MDYGVTNIFYCYGHFNSEGICKYVGKGKGKRAWNFCQRSVRWKKEFGNQNPKVVLFAENLTEAEAFEKEKEKINEFIFAGIDLINVFTEFPSSNLSDDRAFKILSDLRSGTNHYGFGKKRPKWIIERLHEGKKLKAPKPRLGAKLTDAQKQKLHEAAKSPEALAKMAQSKRGKPLSQEHRAKLSEAGKGRIVSDEVKKKISTSNKGKVSKLKGRTMPQEWRDAISKATMGRRPLTADEQARRLATWKSRGGTTKKAKAVLCVDTGKIYRCAKDAADDIDGSDKHIQACCTGKRKSHKGKTWKYALQL